MIRPQVESNPVSPGSIAGSLLLRLLGKYSPTGMEDEAVQELASWAEERGLKFWIDSAGSVFIAPREVSSINVLLAGHIDTVPGWIEPGSGNDRIWGRGAVDAKGPLASMATGLLLLSKKHSSCPAAVAGLVGEEGDSRGAWRLVRDGLVPPFVIIGEPSGGDKVVVGYRGGFHVEVECRGSGGHSSSPHLGDSALDKAIKLVGAVKTLFNPEDPSGPSIAVTGFEAWEGWNVLPRKAYLRLDVRVPLGLDDSVVALELAYVIKSHGCMGVFHPGLKPVRVSVNSPVPRSLSRSLILHGVKPRPVVKRGTSDMNILGLHTESIAAYGPGDSSMAHTDMEVVGVGELGLAAEVYERSILELCRRSTGGRRVSIRDLV
ncbi:MAG: N-acetyl-lysine deacetylase [Desulfurococcales archaeon]|nr:N-acetyl-lysine deacetylase [Desulfurococcales archaeon]